MPFYIWRGLCSSADISKHLPEFLAQKMNSCKDLQAPALLNRLLVTVVTPTGSGQGHFHSSQILCHTVRYIMSFIFIYRTEENGGDDSQETSR